jgi:hypothetical protein
VREREHSHVTRDIELVGDLHHEADLLALELEDPPALEVAAAERGAGDDVPRQPLHLRPHIHLPSLAVIADQALPPAHRTRAPHIHLRTVPVKRKKKEGDKTKEEA